MPFEIPFISTEQMIDVDRLMVEEYHIELIQMMENAGRNLAALARDRFLNGDPFGRKVVVLAGTGGNGGGALVCARRLKNWGADVIVALTKDAEQYHGTPARQLKILKKMNVPFSVGLLPELNADLIVDGLIGYSLSGPPRGIAKKLIQWTHFQSAPILSLDVPSGINTASGTASRPSIKATATMTLALPKRGFDSPDLKPQIGELYLADISVPPEIYVKLGITDSELLLFRERDIVRLW